MVKIWQTIGKTALVLLLRLASVQQLFKMVYLPISSPQLGFLEAPVTSKNRHLLYLDKTATDRENLTYTFLWWAWQGKHFVPATWNLLPAQPISCETLGHNLSNKSCSKLVTQDWREFLFLFCHFSVRFSVYFVWPSVLNWNNLKWLHVACSSCSVSSVCFKSRAIHM